ncbi:hypothetical protein PproGo58_00480 [Pseudomonas protegens]|nr:hypothetical protein PproGo58_00480 [Pseudomonas protegens]
MLAGKGTGPLRLGQMGPQGRVAGGVGDHLGHRRASPQQVHLAAGQLAVVRNAAATVEQQKRQGRKQKAQKRIK